ncbi:MAG TPA: hypothetical protein VFE48_00805 [Methylomirabilota bacterium]|nr:hypothetical protein [Methylomirabilota bacterium]
MPAPSSVLTTRLIARGAGASLLAAAALPVYLTVAPAWRPLAARLACGALVAIGCARARAWARDALDGPAGSGIDAPAAPAPGVTFDPRFLRLRDDLAAGARRRRYFDVVLWPRLRGLGAEEIERPADRGGPGRRGPSLTAIERVIRRIEDRA